MKYTLFDNGIDSFKAAYHAIYNLNAVVDGGYHYYKDAIISINHANEILFKFVLKERLELLIFEDIKAYIKAKSSLKRSDKQNVLEIDPNLKTVSLLEAMQRLHNLCDMDIPENLYKATLYLNELRNKIMHYEINFPEEELPQIKKLLESCYELSIEFFEKEIGGIEQALKDARYELTQAEIDDYLAEQMMEDR